MATILEKVFDWYFGPILRQKVWTEFRTEIFDHFLTKLLDIIISQSFEQNFDQILDQNEDINFNQCLVQNWLANLDQHSRTTIWDNILEKNWVQTFLQRIDLEICPKILSNNWSKLIRIWSLVLDRHIFQTQLNSTQANLNRFNLIQSCQTQPNKSQLDSTWSNLS